MGGGFAIVCIATVDTLAPKQAFSLAIQNCADVSNIGPDGRCRVDIVNDCCSIGIANQAFNSLTPVDIVARSPWWMNVEAAREFANQVSDGFGPLTTLPVEYEWEPNFAYEPNSDSSRIFAQQYLGALGASLVSNEVDNPNCDGASGQQLCWHAFADRLNAAPSSVPGPLSLS